MKNLTGKKLLVLGGTSAVYDVLRFARDLGIYTIVTAENIIDEVAAMCDETIHISTSDIDALADYISENGVSGVMTGASEFNIQQCIKIAERTGIHFYTTQKQWDMCDNKASFKALCREYGVPVVKQFDPEKPESFQYPVIVKPVDACSARGITVCYDDASYRAAAKKAVEYSSSGRIIVEKYIENGGTTISAKYILNHGKLYLQAVGDRWVLNPDGGKALITWAAQYPSKHTSYYIKNIDPLVRNMFEKAGLKDGCLFMEAMPTKDGIYFYEMGYRISGGMTYKITEMTTDVNELKMLICYTLTGEMCEDEDLQKIDPYMNEKVAGSLAIPIGMGIIGNIEGMEEIKKIPEIRFITQYYHIGDRIVEKNLGTLDQLFARFTIIADGIEHLIDVVNQINHFLSVKDINGNELYVQRFNPQFFVDIRDKECSYEYWN